MGTGPAEVAAVCESVLGELAGAFPTTQVSGSLAQWAAVLGSLQEVIDTASAAQDAAIVQLAAIEPAVLEDGTIIETHRGLGHAALDTPAIVSGALNISAVHAESRVRAALRMAADGPAGTSTATGLGGLHQAMATGHLDSYRAAVIAEELAEAPAQVAATVITALEAHFGSDDAAHLRRRCRRVLTRISPDLLAHRAREQCGLRRWADEPGVDKWVGTFPSEEAAHAWAAIDALAQQYLNQGACPNIERARAKALTDLVAGHATIDTTLTLTLPATLVPDVVVPADAGPGEGDPTQGSAAGEHTGLEGGTADPVPVGEAELGEGQDGSPAMAADLVRVGEGDLVEVTGPHGNQPVYLARSWLTTTAEQANTTGKTTVQVATCHPVTGALLEDTTPNHPSGSRGAEATGPGQAREVHHPPSVDHRDGDADPTSMTSLRLRSNVAATAPRSANGRPQRSARPRPDRTGPRSRWPPGSRPATGAAASPAAPSPPSSATSTTSDPGPTDPPQTPTCSACADATTGSNNDSAGHSP